MAFTGNYTCATFKLGLPSGDFDFTSDTFKIALYTNEATLNADTAGYTSVGEVVASGYTAGGAVLTPSLSIAGGISFIDFDDVNWSGAFTARGALIYKDNGGAVCVLDFGSDKTSSETFQVGFPPNTNTSALIRIS